MRAPSRTMHRPTAAIRGDSNSLIADARGDTSALVARRTAAVFMIFEDTAFGADLAAAMRGAFEDARGALQAQNIEVTEVARKLMALQIMTAVQWGERDPQRLKELAIAAVVPPSSPE